jgi:hypothetical protein
VGAGIREKARAAGQTRYFTGKPCKRGHIAERLTSNWKCVACIDKPLRRKRDSQRVRRKRRENPQWAQERDKKATERHRRRRAADPVFREKCLNRSAQHYAKKVNSTPQTAELHFQIMRLKRAIRERSKDER